MKVPDEYRRPAGRAGWVLAALALGLAAAGWWPRVAAALAPSLLAQREALLGGSQELLVARWRPEAVRPAQPLDGDLIWDQEQQEGFLRLTGLQPTESGRSAYQIWICEDRSVQPHPVQAGLFEVPRGSRTVVAAIRPGRRVSPPRLFLLSREGPEGAILPAREGWVGRAFAPVCLEK